MKHTKKLLALLLALVMVMGMMAGCADGQKTPDTTAGTTASNDTEDTQPQETVTIKWYRQAYNINSDTDKVQAAINEYIEPLIGVNVEIVDENNYNLSMELASGDDVDLYWSAWWAGGFDYINSGAAMDLSDLLDNYPDLKASIPDNVWEAATWNGHNWYIPVLKEAGEGTQIAMPKDVYEKYCSGLESITTISELTPYLEKMRADGMTCAFDTTASAFAAADGRSYFYDVNGLVGVDKDMNVINYTDTPEYAKYVNTMYEWQQAGYIPADQFENHSSDPNYQKQLVANGNYGCYQWAATPDGEANASIRFGTEMVLIDYTPIYMTTTSPAGSLYMINSNSTKADACLKFLGLLYTDPVVANLACFGIEGEHYDIVDGRIQVRDESGYKYGGVWCVTNVMAPDLLVAESEDKKQQYTDFNASCEVSPLCGFTFDQSAVEAEMTALSAVRAEYSELLEHGFYDPAEYLPKYQEALKAAGIDRVVAEVQSQLDAFLAG